MKKNGARFPWRMLGALAGAGLIVLGAVIAIRMIDGKMQKQEIDVLREQVKRAAVSCYASEGRYPQELSYLVEYYGLVYDDTRYNILYDAFASNIMPDIDVMVRGDGRP